MKKEDNNEKVVYPKLSYRIVGILYKVWDEIGWSHKEEYIQKAVAIALRKEEIPFKEQVKVELNFQDEKVGEYYLDFLINNRVVLELKRSNHFSKHDIEQILAYLKTSGHKLGILAHFTREGVRAKRILNTY